MYVSRRSSLEHFVHAVLDGSTFGSRQLRGRTFWVMGGFSCFEFAGDPFISSCYLTEVETRKKSILGSVLGSFPWHLLI